jgi:hypothetical protein
MRTRMILLLAPLLLCQSICAFGFGKCLKSAEEGIHHDVKARKISITDMQKQLSLVIDYASGCKISRMMIKGKNVLSPAGAYTGFRTNEDVLSGKATQVKVKQSGNTIELSNIAFGTQQIEAMETWKFSLSGSKILWNISREYSTGGTIDETYFPKWNFAAMDTWKGGIIDNGGMVWCKYLSRVNDTYGVHTGGITFWEPVSGNGLRIAAKSGTGSEIASGFSHSNQHEFTFTQLVSDTTMNQRYDLSRFVSGKADVFAPFKVSKGTVSLNLVLEYVDYQSVYSRGNLPGIDAAAVRELLNTTGRYGVVDNNVIGANGWVTNWKCLHEPFFAQIGMALSDPNYTANFSSTLDQERDLAMLADGRVLSRWHNAPGDEIAGTYNKKTGYYEAMWGYTIDSQTGYVINASEQFDLNGDTKWLRGHKESCEKALDWLIRRDENKNGIFEMKNNGIAEEKASDWLDIVWASYENAFVNAQMYEALNLWAGCERVLGDLKKAQYYREVAQRMKIAFNLPVEKGGFWSEAKQQYVYWRDKNGSVHGDNLVTPVNFAVIAFGLCDDPKRIAAVLNQIEKRNTGENLFHWPLCFDSFKREEVQHGNWPFPRYENGDIFPTWGYLGIRAYAGYDKGIALKYIKNILEQYNKDGLSSQRYSRLTQKGLGEDILAGISTSITALYRDIYGIRPRWNRMGLEPNMAKELDGTAFKYNLRDTIYELKLSAGNYNMSTGKFSVSSKLSFGASQKGKELVLYRDNQEKQTMHVTNAAGQIIRVELQEWTDESCKLMFIGTGKYSMTLSGLESGSDYSIGNDKTDLQMKADSKGSLSVKNLKGGGTLSIRRKG